MTAALPVVSPNTGAAFGHWQPTPDGEVDAALARADASLPNLESVAERARILEACAEALLAWRDRLAGMVVREVGKKPAEAAGEVDYAAGFFRAARTALDGATFEVRPGEGRLVQEVPYGAALLIAPFNDPLAGLARKIAPALAAGAPAIVKPSRLGILSAGEFMAALREVGAGEFVQQIAPERSTAVTDLVADPRIGVVSFTGSTSVGHQLAVRAAGEGKKAILELGGNCPFVVLEDADCEQALDDLLDRKLRCAGQACSAVNRVLVAASRFATFRDALMDRVASLQTGPSDRPGIDLGPVRSRGAVEGLRGLVGEAERRGERLLNGMPPLPEPGTPTLAPLTVVEAAGKSVFDERESFGPALCIQPFRSLDEVLASLARERQALAAYFYTGDAGTLAPRLRRLRFGSIGINSIAVQDPGVPTGGFWSAGIGREGGIWGVREFLAPVNLRMGAARDAV